MTTFRLSEWVDEMSALRERPSAPETTMRVRWWLREAPTTGELLQPLPQLWLALFDASPAERARPVVVFPIRELRVPDHWRQGDLVAVAGEARPGGACVIRRDGEEFWPHEVPRQRVLGAPRWSMSIVGSADTGRSGWVRFNPFIEEERRSVQIALVALWAVTIVVRLTAPIIPDLVTSVALVAILAALLLLWSAASRGRE